MRVRVVSVRRTSPLLEPNLPGFYMIVPGVAMNGSGRQPVLDVPWLAGHEQIVDARCAERYRRSLLTGGP